MALNDKQIIPTAVKINADGSAVIWSTERKFKRIRPNMLCLSRKLSFYLQYSDILMEVPGDRAGTPVIELDDAQVM